MTRMPTEPRRTPGQERKIAALLTRLATIRALEDRVHTEIDRLLLLAWNAGVTDATIAGLLNVSVNHAARMRRRRARRPERANA